MKLQNKNRPKANCKIWQGIMETLTGAGKSFIWSKHVPGTFNIFLIQNKGKGPPGGSHSRDWSDSLIPEIKPAAGKSSNKYRQVIKYQYFITYNN